MQQFFLEHIGTFFIVGGIIFSLVSFIAMNRVNHIIDFLRQNPTTRNLLGEMTARIEQQKEERTNDPKWTNPLGSCLFGFSLSGLCVLLAKWSLVASFLLAFIIIFAQLKLAFPPKTKSK